MYFAISVFRHWHGRFLVDLPQLIEQFLHFGRDGGGRIRPRGGDRRSDHRRFHEQAPLGNRHLIPLERRGDARHLPYVADAYEFADLNQTRLASPCVDDRHHVLVDEHVTRVLS